MKIIVSYTQLQKIIDLITIPFKNELIKKYAEKIVKKSKYIYISPSEMGVIKVFLLTKGYRPLYESIFKIYILTTEDNVRKYHDDKIYTVSPYGNITKLITLNGLKNYRGRKWKAYDSKEKARKESEKLRWKPNQLYWVKHLHNKHKFYSIRYSANKVGYFHMPQEKTGPVVLYNDFEIIKQNIKLPTF